MLDENNPWLNPFGNAKADEKPWKKRLKNSFYKTMAMVLFMLFLSFFCAKYSPIMGGFTLGSSESAEKIAADTLLFYVIPPILYGMMQNWDNEKRFRTALCYPEKRVSFSKAAKDALKSPDFWLDSALFLLLLSFCTSRHATVLFLIYQFRFSSVFAFLGKGLLYTLPMFFILLAVEANFRRDMHRQWRIHGMELDDQGRPMLSVTEKKNVLLNLAYLTLISMALPIFIPLFNMTTTLVVASLPYSDVLLPVLIIWILHRMFRRFYKIHKKKAHFHKRMEEICRERGYTYRWEKGTLRDLFRCSGRQDFSVDTGEKYYAGTILPVFNKEAGLFFWENPAYRFEKRILSYDFCFPKHKLAVDFSPISPNGKQGMKIVLLTQYPKACYYGDEEIAREMGNSERIRDFHVYEADAFANLIDRMHLIKPENVK